MANKKISQLTAAAPLTGTELVPIVQGGITVKTTVENITDIVRPYKVYTALLTQSGANPPVATVLENTIGNISFGYLSVGTYEIIGPNAWDGSSLWYGLVGIGDAGVWDTGISRITLEGDNLYILSTLLDYSATINNNMIRTPIEIRVYN